MTQPWIVQAAPEPISVDARGLLSLFSLTPRQVETLGVLPRRIGRGRVWLVAEVKRALGVAVERADEAKALVDGMFGQEKTG